MVLTLLLLLFSCHLCCVDVDATSAVYCYYHDCVVVGGVFVWFPVPVFGVDSHCSVYAHVVDVRVAIVIGVVAAVCVTRLLLMFTYTLLVLVVLRVITMLRLLFTFTL